jgi:hypothetical protein
MNVKGTVNGDLLTLVINLKETPVISKSEAEKAAKAGRSPVATQIASTGGFTQFGDVKVSLNAMKA